MCTPMSPGYCSTRRTAVRQCALSLRAAIAADRFPLSPRVEMLRAILAKLLEFRNPVTVITKGALIERDLDLLAALAQAGLTRVYVSITTLDPELKRTLEPRAG